MCRRPLEHTKRPFERAIPVFHSAIPYFRPSDLLLCEIQVDRTGAGTAFGPLAFDTTPGYTDTEPFPATPTKWTYRAIYRVGDQRVGQWSKSVSITVGG